MKNVVKRRWDPPKPPPHRKHEAALEPLAEADKAVLRGNLIEAIAVAAPQVRSQLALCLKHVAFSDYPERWPDLLAQIGAKLRMTDNESQLHGGLLALRVLAKIHEYRQDTKAKNEIVGETFYVLLGMLRQLLSAAPTVAACELACLAAKVVHSCVCYELPTLLLSQPAAVDPFFEVLVGLLTQPLPPGAPTEADEAGNWSPWKLKKRVAQMLHRTLQRHGNPNAGSGSADAVAGGSAGEAAARPSRRRSRRWRRRSRRSRAASRTGGRRAASAASSSLSSSRARARPPRSRRASTTSPSATSTRRSSTRRPT